MPRLVDICCKAGGASVGYRRAGFEVIGIDVEPQPHYPYEFIRADLLELTAADLLELGITAAHASPPCKVHSALKHFASAEHVNLIPQTRDLLRATGLPYVIENVPGAPLHDPVELCGAAFQYPIVCADGRRRQLRRHRLFESNVWLNGTQCAGHRWPAIGVYGQGPAAYDPAGGRRGAYQGNPAENAAAMGIDWMNRDELAQAIPPAFAEHLGAQLLDHLRAAA